MARVQWEQIAGRTNGRNRSGSPSNVQITERRLLHMRRRTIAALIACSSFLLLTIAAAAASDWTGVYARIDKVVFEPNESAPERVQVWGVFAVASRPDRSRYDPAARGYLYLTLRSGKEDICRKEWADLKAVAGKGEIVTFG